jgi:hypothetical protein
MLILRIGRMRFLFLVSPFSTWANIPHHKLGGTSSILCTKCLTEREVVKEKDNLLCVLMMNERHLSLQVGGILWFPVNNPIAPTKWLAWNLWSALHWIHYYFEIVVQCIILYLGNWSTFRGHFILPPKGTSHIRNCDVIYTTFYIPWQMWDYITWNF